ncbi:MULTISPECIES: hypothetical protein [unclassified Rhizobium]|uniref:hypothetical protein n=1 Tax=unclassified Rhizobium TaxID=2613769 RepID=UPI0007F109D3|nr:MULTISPECIES: hypothetical protein [unclassified Rhizobium]ANM11003.1 hypothetical protein AMK05_CH02629 [Rhizobium sp. N324]ANM17544.1 hypothetical protein AMK06_CH02656 [Rhizobium sp. N541]ANM23929.1 hypothetical protein AMK07_CH02653 [Rhizobium sp. N941]OYD04604.1 hypothetical protein AMK08_CH102648 [Rhizobium sp. N4311]
MIVREVDDSRRNLTFIPANISNANVPGVPTDEQHGAITVYWLDNQSATPAVGVDSVYHNLHLGAPIAEQDAVWITLLQGLELYVVGAVQRDTLQCLGGMDIAKTFGASLALIAATSWISAATAGELDMRLFGHHVAISKTTDSQDSLKIDDREVLKNYYVDIDKVHVVKGIGVAVGTSSAGGNAREGSPFVISFPNDGNPRIDRPFDSCFPVTVKPSEETLILSSSATPNQPGQKWEWSASAGFKEVKGEAFVADTKKGLDQLRERFVTHPGGLLDYAEIGAEINRLAGSDKALVNDILIGVGSGEFKGDLFVGTSCSRHMCMDQEAVVVADLASRTIYLAWKPSGQKIKVNPPVKEWPDKAKAELREWAAKWK